MIRETLPLRLKFLRKQSGLTTKEVGNMIGKSDRTISAWENGRGQPDADALLQLCKAYAVTSISELIGENATVLTDDEFNLVLAYRNLSSQGQRYLRETVSMVKERYKKNIDLPRVETNTNGGFLND